jgi:hypothetical protein
MVPMRNRRARCWTPSIPVEGQPVAYRGRLHLRLCNILGGKDGPVQKLPLEMHV